MGIAKARLTWAPGILVGLAQAACGGSGEPPITIAETTGSPISKAVNDPAGDERTFWDGVAFDGVVPASKPEDLL